VELSVETPDALDIVGDRRATKQVLLNILANAVKFASDDGRVRLRAHMAGPRAIVTVGDDGIGIPAEALKNLGRPFEQVENELTRTNKGTGLGLAIARSLVELHGGRMRIMSKVGRGTVVAFSLPVEPAAAQPAPEVEARSLSPARSAQNAACALAA
jgi:two-component system, cell cycle sensor histidine kinase PleC